MLSIPSFTTDRVFGPSTSSQDVYDVAARPVVKAAMEGVNGMLSYICNSKTLFFFSFWLNL